ncbi:LSU ribosomal protein L32P [Sinobaca qinghaiensis]|uniref:Large ribosomal subunit protein bL32 n=1 Tax=Sinobaca qinghaiensis TaxID=342944 RepID=A0A419V648_9BACL|nr:50S ribosomal protein L32 [Sinobaca qinghaiensis]RKD75462.1 LSU ribosomal protein L32P [Sinobaca qinghaiensis]
MAVPFRRTSKTRKRQRRSHLRMEIPGMVKCPDCGEMKLSHRICKNCGSYKGETVIEKK